MIDSGASEQTGMGLVALPGGEPETSERRNTTVQDEYIAQLLQKMATMQTEIERLLNLTNLSISLNTPLPEPGTSATAPQTFPSPEPSFPQNLPQNPLLSKTNPQLASLQCTNPHPINPQASPQNDPEIDQYEEMERQARIRTDESMAREIRSLKEAFKNIQTSKGHEGLEYEDLCMYPDVQLPIRYKVPKFDLFDGKGNPRAHLRSYCDKLVGVGHIPKPIPRSYDETKHCAYHSGITGHDTGVCFALKDKIEALIKEGIIQLKGPPPNVNNNPLPNHDNANVNMIIVDEEKSLEGTIVPVRIEEKVESSAFITPIITVQSYSTGEKSRGKEKQIVEVVVAGMTRSGRCYAPADNPKKVVTETEVEEFWRKMPTKEYSVVEQLKKTPAQISLLSLSINSPTHTRALLEVLKEAYVLRETIGEKLSALVGQILEVHKVFFHDKELPPEGLGHNKALNITVKCMNKFISKVLIDGGSAVNICPMATLRALGISIGKIRESHVRVKGFDGAQRSVMREMDLTLQVGLVEFVMEFQVLDISTDYNLLMGRPLIHMAGAVHSTLHQSLKFVWDHHEVVIHGEGSNSICPEGQIPVVESVDILDGSVFHVREITCASKAEKLKLPRVLTMVAQEMLKNGFKPGQGLGLNLEGMVELVHLLSKNDTFGLGYEPTSEEVLSVNLRKEKDTPQPKHVPPLNQSFVKAYDAQE
ncbi:hypothetical protein K7X08_013660 [Anisodus acutangulus]|uniref:G-patch domain-containing protein n=1 Tax=Anisodus acutangulus TaxID=402998 RepID=A0A9Q1R2C7_9SOLA|nr:hypothetical protein K7X08_013660 [Anisodus acutangulus]